MKRAIFLDTTGYHETGLMEVPPLYGEMPSCFINRTGMAFRSSVSRWLSRSIIAVFFLLSVLTGKSQITMPDMLKPADSWGLIDVNSLYGGFMQVDSYTALQNVRVQFLKRGMIFVVYDYDGINSNGIDTRAYMFLPAAGAWTYNTPFQVPAATQSKTIATALLETYLVPVSLGLSAGSTIIADNTISASKLQGASSAALANGLAGSVLQSNGDGTFSWGSATLPSLSGLGAATADVSLSGYKIINLADPLSAQDAATKNYVDNTVGSETTRATAAEGANATAILALNADTATIQPRLNDIIASIPNITGKVNISDTAAMLANYKSAILANSTNIAALIIDTATIQPRLNNIIASMPNISGKVNISDTAAMLSNYLTGIALKANLASPAFTGTPTAPTPVSTDVSTSLATTAFVATAVGAATIPDASVSVKGKIQLAGDLTGTADLPTVANNAITTAKIADANITTAKILDANVTTSKLADASVTYAKIQNITPARLLGNPTGTAGASHEIALGTGLRFSGDSLYSSGGGTGSVDTFTSNITVTSTNGLGKYATGSTITAIGKTASQVLIDALTQVIAPTYTAPTASIASAPGGGNVEIGSNLSVTLTGTFNQNDGGAETSRTYYVGATALGSNTNTVSSLTSAVSYKVVINYAQGACKNNNQGAQDCTGRIGANSATSGVVTFTPVAQRYWGRCSGVPNNATIIAAAGGSGGGSELIASKTKTGFSVTASGSNNIYFAYPASLGALTAISVGGFDSFSAFTQNTVSFTNASNYAQSYYVYVSNNTFSGDATNINVQ